MSLGACISRFWLKIPKRLIRESNTKCYSVGLQIGIRDETHFAQWFKRLTRVNPREYCLNGYNAADLHASVKEINHKWPENFVDKWGSDNVSLRVHSTLIQSERISEP